MRRQAAGSQLLAFALAAIAVVSALGCRGARPAPPAAPVEVSVVTVRPEPVVLTTELPGRTCAYLVAEVRPQVSGLLQERLFVEGSDVKAGSVLYRIDPAPYEAAYDQAKAALAVAEANLPAARSLAERLEGLVRIRAVGQQDYDNALSAKLRAEASVASAKAASEAARINLAYTPVKAPISGRIGKSAVTVGAMVTAYQPVALALIQQLDPIYVDVTQSSADLLRLRRGLASGQLKNSGSLNVKLLLEDGTPYAREGQLQFRDVTVDPSTGSVVLRMVFPNSDHVLLPGMFVRAIVEQGVNEQGILAPQQGVVRNRRGDAEALVVDKDGKVAQRTLEVDRAIADRWLVTRGLAAGDQVIVDNLQRIRPGDTVKVVPFAPKAGPAGAVAEAQPAAAGK